MERFEGANRWTRRRTVKRQLFEQLLAYGGVSYSPVFHAVLRELGKTHFSGAEHAIGSKQIANALFPESTVATSTVTRSKLRRDSTSYARASRVRDLHSSLLAEQQAERTSDRTRDSRITVGWCARPSTLLRLGPCSWLAMSEHTFASSRRRVEWCAQRGTYHLPLPCTVRGTVVRASSTSVRTARA